MFAKITSLGLRGLTGFAVTAEADLAPGLPALTLVGLPDSAVKETADRVRSALKNLGYTWPVSRITVNLAPADVRKTGPVYDLPVLLALLCASGQLPAVNECFAFIGELSLDGQLRPVTGVLPMALAAAQQGATALFVPQANAAEAAVVQGLTVYGAADAKAGCCGSVTDLFALPFNHHPMVEQGLRAEEAGALLQAFFKDLRVRLAARPKWKRPAPPAENMKKP